MANGITTAVELHGSRAARDPSARLVGGIGLTAAITGIAWGGWLLLTRLGQLWQIVTAWAGGTAISAASTGGPITRITRTRELADGLTTALGDIVLVSNDGDAALWFTLNEIASAEGGGPESTAWLHLGPLSAALAHALVALGLVIAAGFAGLLALRLLRHDPFATAVPRFARRAGAILAAAGLLALPLTVLAHAALPMIMAGIWNPANITSGTRIINVTPWSDPPAWEQPALLIGTGLGLLLLATVFRQAERLRRDTEGLV